MCLFAPYAAWCNIPQCNLYSNVTLSCMFVYAYKSRRLEAPPLPHRDDSSSPPPLPPRCQPPSDLSAINGSGAGDSFSTPVACFPIIATSGAPPNATTACVNGLQLQLVSCYPPELLMEISPEIQEQVGLVDIRQPGDKTSRRYSAPPGYLVPLL